MSDMKKIKNRVMLRNYIMQYEKVLIVKNGHNTAMYVYVHTNEDGSQTWAIAQPSDLGVLELNIITIIDTPVTLNNVTDEFKHIMAIVTGCLNHHDQGTFKPACNCLLDLATVESHYDCYEWPTGTLNNKVEYIHVYLPTKKQPEPSVN